ncbi:hypothetical protein ACI78S_05350 [Geodermatophilus sp. SYSU D00815]
MASSDPGAVERWEAGRLLDERVVLATAVVRELQGGEGRYTSGRARAALDLLRGWVGRRYEAGVETHPSDGLASMVVPPGHEEVMAELVAATEVCEALAMLWTADTQRESDGDKAHLRGLLERYPY